MSPFFGLKEISLRDYFNIIWKRKTIVLAIILIAAVSGGLIDLRTPKVYETESTILISNPREELPLYDLLNSPSMAMRVAKALNLDENPEQMLESVKGTLHENRNIVKIRVQGEDPEEIKDIANEWAKEFVSLLLKKESGPEKDIFISGIHVVFAEKSASLPRGWKVAEFSGWGLFIGLFICFVLEILDSTIKRAGEVEYYTKIPFLGFVPLSEKESATERERDLISYLKPASSLAETFRNVRTSMLMAVPRGMDLKTILVTSARASEGRTFVAANLAVNLATHGLRVLLIDTDKKRPRLGESFAIDERLDASIYGLSDVLEGRATLEETIVKTPIKGLSLLEAGSAFSRLPELIKKGPFKHMMQEICSVFDKVVIDSGPVLDADETLLMAEVCDGIVYVIGTEITTPDDVSKAKEKLNENAKKLIGAVLNSRAVGAGKDLQYYYQQFQNFLGKKPGEPDDE